MKRALINKLNFLKKVVIIAATVVAICCLIYFFYWMGKSGSYFLFYEDMVQDTIREMVKAGSLK